MSARGAQHTMPLLVINMGGEMVYILEQRLTAQNVAKDKASRVLQDVVKTMFSRKFTIELFKPQEMYTDAAMRAIFDKLAHSSIMRLNEASMTKLYSLMVMGFKHQILAATEPRMLLDITERHLRSLKPVCNAPDVDDLLDETFAMCSDLYSSFTYGDWMLLKSFLCDFYQNRKIRVSLFLASGIQSMDGTIALSNTGACRPAARRPARSSTSSAARRSTCRVYTRERERERPRPAARARARRAREHGDASGKHRARCRSACALPVLEGETRGERGSVEHGDEGGRSLRAPLGVRQRERARARDDEGARGSRGLVSPLSPSPRARALSLCVPDAPRARPGRAQENEDKAGSKSDGAGSKGVAGASARRAPRASTARAEMNLLASLMGSAAEETEGKGTDGDGGGGSFRINLFPDDTFGFGTGGGDIMGVDDDPDASSQPKGINTVHIDGSMGRKTAAKMLEEMDFHDGGGAKGGDSASKAAADDDDLLDSMDKL